MYLIKISFLRSVDVKYKSNCVWLKTIVYTLYSRVI